MATYKATSWGRTRRPKHPLGTDKHTITGSTQAKLNLLTVDNFTAENGVYKTENQRYAHIACSGSTTEVLNVFLYNHASGFWHELVTGSANSSVVVGPNQHQIIDINGADYIALTSGSNVQVVTMAFSTF
jgi:hypothetical protein